MTNKKRYGVIVERKAINEENFKYNGIYYCGTLKEAKQIVNYVDNYDSDLQTYRAYGIFDYEKIVYKYIINEKED